MRDKPLLGREKGTKVPEHVRRARSADRLNKADEEYRNYLERKIAAEDALKLPVDSAYRDDSKLNE